MSNNGNQIWDDTHLQWLAIELTSGLPIAELPDLQVSQLSVRMMDQTECAAYLPYDNAPINWLDATTPYKVALLLTRDSVVLWGGIILQRKRDISGASLELKLATVEHYLDSVYVTDAHYKQLPQTTIIQRLVSMTAGHRFNIACVPSASGIKRDRDYSAEQDKTLLSAMQELSNVINGPEWCSGWVVNDDGMSFKPVITTADHIGSLVPTATFDSSIMTDFSVLEDYSSGFGANRVQASSTAEGEVRPTSKWHTSTDTSRPLIEHKFTPSTSIINVPVLDQHAERKLKQLQDGTTTITFSAALLEAPKIGVEWNLGDVVYYDVTDDYKQFPDKGSGVLRVIGYDIGFQGAWTMTPVLRPLEQAGD